MRKKNLLTWLTVTCFFCGALVVSADTTACEEMFGPDTMQFIRTVVTIIRWAVPIVLIFLVSLDFFKAVTSPDPHNDMTKATKNSILRLIAAMLIFLAPSLLNLFLDLINSSTCGL